MKIFLSCVSAEFKDCRDALASDLRAIGCEVRVQEDFQQGPGNLIQKLQDYVAQCDRVIAVIGDAHGWEASDASVPTDRPGRSYTQWEYFFALGERISGPLAAQKELYVYFASEQFLADHRVAQTAAHAERQQQFRTEVEKSGKDWGRFDNVDQLCRFVLRDGWQMNERPHKPRNLPYAPLGSLFKGREGVLQDLNRRLNPNPTRVEAIIATTHAVHGLGGVGKTRLAVEYAHRYAEEYSALLFVVADSPEALSRNLAALCDPPVLNLPERERKEEEGGTAAALRWLQMHPGWLLILDNVDTTAAASAVEGILGQLTAGQVLLTSRLDAWAGNVQTLALDVLTETDAVAFLLERTDARRRKTSEDAAQARALAAELGQLALALEQASAYIARHRLSFVDYLREWQLHHDTVMEWFDERVMKYPQSMAATWLTSFEHLNVPARHLLERLAWFSPEPIPESLLDVAMTGAGDTDPNSSVVNADPREALATLEAYSLVVRAADTPVFSVHRLVQDVARRNQRDDASRQALTEALLWLDAAFGGDPTDVRSWPELNPLTEHCRAVAAYADEAGITDPTARLLNQAGLLLKGRGLFSQAEPLMRRALAIVEQSFGESHPIVAACKNNLASLLKDTNRLEEAEPLMRRALAIEEQSFGADSPTVATCLNNLAPLLQATNRLGEAESLMRRALAIEEQSGADHPTAVTSLINLASLLQATNRLAEAEPLMRRALAIGEQSFGTDHPKVAACLSNLASLLQATNRLAEAEPHAPCPGHR